MTHYPVFDLTIRCRGLVRRHGRTDHCWNPVKAGERYCWLHGAR